MMNTLRDMASKAFLAFSAVVLTLGLAGGTRAEDGSPEIPEPGGGLVFVAFDLIPGACPNYFNNLFGRPIDQFMTTSIVGDEDVQSNQIVESSLLLTVPGGGGGDPVSRNTTKILPVEVYPQDVTVPIVAPVDCECTTDGPDGMLDLIVRFDADEVAAALDGFEGGDEVVLWISGDLLDGRSIIGYDCLQISGTVGVEEPTWGSVKARYR